MRYLTYSQLLRLYERLIQESGGSAGIREQGGIESALAQPQITFGGDDLYPTLAEKAAALGFSLIMNHPFVDGNKRIGHAAMEAFLLLNRHEIVASVDEQEQVILQVAAGKLRRSEFTEWVTAHITPIEWPL
ncbi:MAG: type II toxin-antitoxin system death-on-curing family toxin [Caldilineaceae bacterium]|nr:type II toxin-antitoxin system death-on-curing family toxin [Caldilineaceae bacterium]